MKNEQYLVIPKEALMVLLSKVHLSIERIARAASMKFLKVI